MQIALDRANALMNKVVAGDLPSYDAIRDELAEAYRVGSYVCCWANSSSGGTTIAQRKQVLDEAMTVAALWRWARVQG